MSNASNQEISAKATVTQKSDEHPAEDKTMGSQIQDFLRQHAGMTPQMTDAQLMKSNAAGIGKSGGNGNLDVHVDASNNQDAIQRKPLN